MNPLADTLAEAVRAERLALLSDLTPYLIGLAGLFGVIIGSFLNVVIYRVPAGLSIVSPPSACPGCDAPIRARDNVPVLSWMLLRGRCRSCAEPISVRYPLVEVITGVLFSATTWWALAHAPALAPVLLYVSAVGVALFLIDLDCQRLPDAIVLPSYPIVAAGLGLAGWLSGEWPWTTVAFSALVWGATFAIPYYLTQGRGMGFGDVKLAPLLGAVLGALGWGASLVGLLSGFVFGTVVGVALMSLGKAGRKTKVPFGPFMLLGAGFGLVFGRPVFDFYLRLTGLA